jgi:Cu/Ag efflux protein CusF
MATRIHKIGTATGDGMMKTNLRWFYQSILLIFILAGLAACNKSTSSSSPASQSSSAGTVGDSSSAIKHYPFKGKIVSVDAMSKSASIDGADIPGFMSAMTMSYEIHPDSDLQKLHAGDSIQADIVVDNSDSNNEKYWLEHVAAVPAAKEP